VATSMAPFATGKPNAFKASHLAHYQRSFMTYLKATREKLDTVTEELPIATYFAGDWLTHVDEAIRRGAGVIAYPPTFRGGYEKLFAFVNDNVDWTPPKYDIFDPETMPQVLDRLDRGGIPYFIYADQVVEGRRPVVEFTPKGKRTVYGYANSERTGYLGSATKFEPFAYTPVDVGKLTEQTVCRVVPASAYQLNFLRHAYLKKTIMFGQGDAHMLVFLDDTLAGGIVYRLARQTFAPLEVLSDFSVTREGRVAKLIARLATLRISLKVMEMRLLERFPKVRTQAFSDHPEAMKYRGSWKLLKREEDSRQGAKYVLTYESEVRDESPQEAYARWWKRDGAKQVGVARDRASAGGSSGAQAA